jgi:DNA-binding CsgD family transcriptional regulator
MALRTVECHLADIYTKLGVDSRVQLAVVLANRAADTLGAEWLSLTEAEKDVAALVGAGMSNRLAASQLYLYLSPKTVEFHLGRIYRKPRVTSRCQLPRPAPQAAKVVSYGRQCASFVLGSHDLDRESVVWRVPDTAGGIFGF